MPSKYYLLFPFFCSKFLLFGSATWSEETIRLKPSLLKDQNWNDSHFTVVIKLQEFATNFLFAIRQLYPFEGPLFISTFYWPANNTWYRFFEIRFRLFLYDGAIFVEQRFFARVLKNTILNHEMLFVENRVKRTYLKAYLKSRCLTSITLVPSSSAANVKYLVSRGGALLTNPLATLNRKGSELLD